MGLLEFQSLEDSARDIDLTNYDGLLRMVLVGPGIKAYGRTACTGIRGTFLGHCKSVCRTLNLVLEQKIANAVVLAGSIGVPHSLKTTETGAGDSQADGRAHVSGAGQDQNLAETLKVLGERLYAATLTEKGGMHEQKRIWVRGLHPAHAEGPVEEEAKPKAGSSGGDTLVCARRPTPSAPPCSLVARSRRR